MKYKYKVGETVIITTHIDKEKGTTIKRRISTWTVRKNQNTDGE